MFTRHPFDRERAEIPSTEPFYRRSPGGSKFRPGSPMYSRLNVFPGNKRYLSAKKREREEERYRYRDQKRNGRRERKYTEGEASANNESYDAE